MKNEMEIFWEILAKVGDVEQEEKAVEMVIDEILNEEESGFNDLVNLILNGEGNSVREKLGISAKGFDKIWGRVVFGLEKKVVERMLEVRDKELWLVI